ncbi:C4b-binding protein alpha chain isoform 2-T2 [Molossus nigricans]
MIESSTSSSATCRKMEKSQVTYSSGAPNGTLDRKRKMTTWLFSRLWRVSDPTLFQVTLVAALLATVLGDCGIPPNLPFASPIQELNKTSYEVGTILKYTCRPGYSKTGSRNQILMCQKGGTWYYSNFCVKKHCSNPGELHNGQVIIKTDYSFGSHIEFNCLEGYVLVGSTTSYCEIQDRTVGWSDSFPKCVIAHCETPPDISNGRHNAGNEDVYTYGFSVTYSCDPGFSLLGKPSISCTVENKTKGVWSPSPPTCKKVTCPQPNINYGRIATGFRPTYIYRDTVAFECNKGFTLKGSSVVHCDADDNWKPPLPICEINSCRGLPVIPHASWERYGYQTPAKDKLYEAGTSLKYRCHLGYKPAGDKPTIVSCQKNLQWSPYAECEELCCPIPELKNGKITENRTRGLPSNCVYFFGDVIKYSCYGRRQSEASCQGDGTWSPETPTCGESCSYPPYIAHGRHQQISNFFGNKEIRYECDEGYALVGKPTLSCSYSRWSGPAPQCKALCPKPEVEHGKLSGDQNQFVESENVTIQCDSGYSVVGPESIICLENGTWDPEVPKCEWELPEGCEQVLPGRKLMQCLPRVEDVKMALELHKLSLEIELLKLQLDKARKSSPESPLCFFPGEKGTLVPSIQ